MLSFECDYNNGAHPLVLQRLIETNSTAQIGYGADEYSKSAIQKIREYCGKPQAEVYLLAGGTQTNIVVLSAILRPYEGVVCATSGHINSHEAGAIENAGIKALPLPSHEGKIDASEFASYLQSFYSDENREHMVYPGAVYISHPSEYGTLYSKDELHAISGLCKAYGLRLFLDGARLGYGLMSRNTDVTISDICDCCDVLYIGGTKIGALCGEAVVFPNGNIPDHFPNHVKKLGAMMAKGRLLGAQFEALFTDGLYNSISRHAIDMACQMRALFHQEHIRFFLETDTNQQFVVLENDLMKQLSKEVRFSYWERFDDSHTVVRFATSWSTTQRDIDMLHSILAKHNEHL